MALDGEDGTTAQRDQDTTPGTAAVELADGYKPWEDAALDNEPLLHGVFGTNKISLGWLEDHEIPYVPTLQYFRGLIGMHQSGTQAYHRNAQYSPDPKFRLTTVCSRLTIKKLLVSVQILPMICQGTLWNCRNSSTT